MNDTNSLAHAKWNCKYHIVFAVMYRRKILYREMRGEIGKILKELCSWKQGNNTKTRLRVASNNPLAGGRSYVRL